MGDQPQKMQQPPPVVTTMDQIKNFFTPSTTTPVAVQEKNSKRVFYEREVNDHTEMLKGLEKGVSDLDITIDGINKKIAPIAAEIKRLKLAYDGIPNKESTQAKALKTKCMEYMAEESLLTRRIARYKQERLTVNTQLENFRLVRDAKRTQKLLEDSNRAMYGEMATLNLDMVETTAGDARDASRQVNKMSAKMMDPFGVTCEEAMQPFSDQFDELNFAEDNYIEDPFLLNPPVAQTTRQSPYPNNKHTVALEDDIF